jgi:hypothetical protein
MSSKCVIDLEPDCPACAALCCVVFAFDKSESFAIDKAAGEVCPNLENSGKCGIFKNREALGFNGCITYNCHGAGQRITQEVFKGQSWRNDPALTQRMGAALSVLRRVHEQLLLLRTAHKLPLTCDEKNVAEKFEQDLAPEAAWSETSLKTFPIDEVSRKVSAFLRSLSYHISAETSEHT